MFEKPKMPVPISYLDIVKDMRVRVFQTSLPGAFELPRGKEYG